MFRIFILTAIVLAMTLPAAAQRRDACTVIEDPYERASDGFPRVYMSLSYYVPGGLGEVVNYFFPQNTGSFGLGEVEYSIIQYRDGAEIDDFISEPRRPLQAFLFTFQNMWTNEIRPELCNLERMGLIPQAASILGGN